eukprot:scaffold15108_cov180-Amphora_coffeaeformis.AAC.46
MGQRHKHGRRSVVNQNLGRSAAHDVSRHTLSHYIKTQQTKTEKNASAWWEERNTFELAFTLDKSVAYQGGINHSTELLNDRDHPGSKTTLQSNQQAPDIYFLLKTLIIEIILILST